MEILDDMKIDDLNIILNEDTTLKGFYPLISRKEAIINSLIKENITRKYECLALSEEKLCEIMGMSKETIQLFCSFLHLHDFKDRRLAEVEGVNPDFIKSLIEDKVKTSLSYFTLSMEKGFDWIATRYDGSIEDVKKLFDLCDLMRLPGVKSVRANLYWTSGFHRMKDFACQDSIKVQEHIAKIIEEQELLLSVPLRKELKTQIAVAAILPEILCF